MVLDRILFSPFTAYPWLSALIIIVLAIVIFRITVAMYLKYIRFQHLIEKNEWVLLEIIIPQEIQRSPEAMELFFKNGVWWAKGTSKGQSFYRKYIKGETMSTFSFEIVSIGGNVHFYVHAPLSLIDMVQSQLYSQYPQVEIHQVDDYTDRIPYQLRDEMGMAMYSWEYNLDKPDAYPIKTYRDWGTDRSIESLTPEQQIDPLASIIEKLAAIDPWEEMWLQFVVRAHKDNDWRKEGEKLMDGMITGHRRFIKKEDPATPLISTLTAGEQQVVDAIERNIDQQAFDTGIRSVYITRRSKNFKIPAVSYLGNIFASFNTESLNVLKNINGSGYDNPWQDFNGKFEYWMKDRALERYRRRWFFSDQPKNYNLLDTFYYITGDYRRKTMILSSEELATLFHFPGGFAQSPSVQRSDVKKARPPANLPIG